MVIIITMGTGPCLRLRTRTPRMQKVVGATKNTLLLRHDPPSEKGLQAKLQFYFLLVLFFLPHQKITK